MYKIKTTTRFENDFIRCYKRNFDLEKLSDILTLLENTGRLPQKYKTHLLKGNLKGYYECHIKPDWLLIWKTDENNKTIELARTGTHSDLFK